VSAREGLGDLFNLIYSATTSKVRINLQNATGATAFLVGSTGTTNLTLNECNAASGGTEQALAVITKYYQQASGAFGLWVKQTQAAASTIPALNAGVSTFYVPAVALSDGFTYLDATHASGSIVWVIHGLQVKRAPENLKSAIL
jgi:hypothetical protein